MTTTIILLCVYILSSAFPGNVYKKLSNDSKSSAASATMPSVWFLLIGLTFTVVTLATHGEYSLLALPVAAVSGVCMFGACFILIESMKVNALSISVIIVNLNFVIPVILSAIFLSENAGLLQIAGMVISVLIIVLTNISGKQTSKIGKKAIILPLVACLANGLVNFGIKINDKIGGDSFAFFSVMYLTAALTSLVYGLICAKKTLGCAKPIEMSVLKRCLPFMVLLGVLNGVCFYMASLLASRMNAAAQFTIVTCASILLSVAVGIIFQGDKLTKKSVISMIFCAIAVLCQYSGIA
jgi:drug/metabolite transporter (DMT)-like permease